MVVYFGYGSNMWLKQMDKRCPQHTYLGIGYIRDWKWYISPLGYANIKRSPGDIVYGFVFALVKIDEETLDRYEGVPKSYLKEYHPITLLGTKASPQKLETEALIYINEVFLEDGEPKEEYIDRMNCAIADGIKEGIPEDYMEAYLRPFIPKRRPKCDDL
ncbi:hypothetical protein AN958_00751 [Leucoagaricus sp. SymC.cos]|nr:hypothetical protein AN958_00751 [Leucoagaricus sp. SymC.cos]